MVEETPKCPKNAPAPNQRLAILAQLKTPDLLHRSARWRAHARTRKPPAPTPGLPLPWPDQEPPPRRALAADTPQNGLDLPARAKYPPRRRNARTGHARAQDAQATRRPLTPWPLAVMSAPPPRGWPDGLHRLATDTPAHGKGDRLHPLAVMDTPPPLPHRLPLPPPTRRKKVSPKCHQGVTRAKMMGRRTGARETRTLK